MGLAELFWLARLEELALPCEDAVGVPTDDVELFLDLEPPPPLPNELAFPEVGVVILFREIPPVLEEEFCVSDFGVFPGDGGTVADCCENNMHIMYLYPWTFTNLARNHPNGHLEMDTLQ